MMQEVKASVNKLRVSPIKANYVLKAIRGKKAWEALDILKFSRKRIAQDIRKCLFSAMSNAENNHGMDIDALHIRHAYVGKSMTLKRMECRAKGRGNRITKPFSNICVILSGENK